MLALRSSSRPTRPASHSLSTKFRPQCLRILRILRMKITTALSSMASAAPKWCTFPPPSPIRPLKFQISNLQFPPPHPSSCHPSPAPPGSGEEPARFIVGCSAPPPFVSRFPIFEFRSSGPSALPGGTDILVCRLVPHQSRVASHSPRAAPAGPKNAKIRW